MADAATIGPLETAEYSMTKKVASASASASATAASRAEAPRTQPLPIPETKFKTIWQVVNPVEPAGKAKAGKKAVAA